jgi:hypothetical protein
MEESQLLVMRDEGSGLLAVDVKPVTDHFGVVIGPAASQEALQQQGVIQFHQEHQLDRLAQLSEEGIQGHGLGEVAGEPVKEPTALVAFQSVAHNRQHEGIAHELAASHDSLGLLAEGGGRLHLGPQEISRGEVEQPVGGGQALGLGAFARPGWAEEQQALLHGKTK